MGAMKRETMRIEKGEYLPDCQFLWEAHLLDLQALKQRGQGEELPVGYGIAWYEYHRAVAICAPIPLNFVLGWARRIWFRLKQGPRHCVRCGR
jgi:hypothetical protein